MIKKYLHTRFRVSDMEKSVIFYRDILGMKLTEQKTSPRGSELVFLNFPDMNCELELCSFPGSGTVEIPEDLVDVANEWREKMGYLAYWVAAKKLKTR